MNNSWKVSPVTRWDITAREQEVLNLLAIEGLYPKEVAFRLGISPKTLRAHMEHMRAKMGVRTSSQVTLAWQRECVAQEQLDKQAQHVASLKDYQHCPRCNGFGFVPKAVA